MSGEILHPNSYNLSGARSILVDVNGNPLTVDGATLDQVFIDQAHHEQHEQHHFFIKGVTDVTGAGTTQYFTFVTPPGPVRIHAKAKISAESEFWVGIYAEGEVSAPGNEVPGQNNDQASIIRPGLRGWDSPTVSFDGYLKWQSQTGTGNKPTGVSPEFGYEILAKPETRYIFKSIKEAAGTHYIDFDFWWYEHTPST